MSKQIIILILVIFIIFIILTYRNQENITSDSGKTLSDEAIQTIASVYNKQNMIVTNLNATGNTQLNSLNVSGYTQLNSLNVNDNTQLNSLNVNGSLMAKNINSEKIWSPNKNYYFSIQDDGNLFLYDNSGNAYRKIKQWIYKGCYKDCVGGRVLSDNPGNLGISDCQKYAEFKGYKYMGSQYGGQCFAGDTDPTVQGIGDANNCTSILGGSCTNQVWEYK